MTAEETPWGLVQRMLAAGDPLDDIIASLKARGLDREDIELLLQDLPEFQASRRVAPVVEDVPAPERPDVPLVDSAPGSPLRWIGIGMLLFVGLVTALVANFGSTSALVGTALSAALTLPLLVSEFANGRRRTFKRLGLSLSFLFLIPAGVALGVSGVDPFSVSYALLAIAGLVLLGVASRGKEVLPGIESMHPDAPVFEHDDVQFLPFSPKQETFAPGESVEIVILAQNCVDAPRELFVRFEGARDDLGTERQLSFALAPGEIVEITAPIRLGALAREIVHFTFTIAGRGDGGRRLRFSQGVEWVTPNAQALKNALGVMSLGVVGLATFTLGSNGNVRVKCDDTKPYVPTGREPSTKVVFVPTPEQLALASRS